MSWLLAHTAAVTLQYLFLLRAAEGKPRLENAKWASATFFLYRRNALGVLSDNRSRFCYQAFLKRWRNNPSMNKLVEADRVSKRRNSISAARRNQGIESNSKDRQHKAHELIENFVGAMRNVPIIHAEQPRTCNAQLRNTNAGSQHGVDARDAEPEARACMFQNVFRKLTVRQVLFRTG
jgi:hypothetical protein